jgi:hypothetical protein
MLAFIIIIIAFTLDAKLLEERKLLSHWRDYAGKAI